MRKHSRTEQMRDIFLNLGLAGAAARVLEYIYTQTSST